MVMLDWMRDAPEHLASLQVLARLDSPARLDCPTTSRDLYCTANVSQC